MNDSEGTNEFCSPGRALVHFDDGHVMWSGPIALMYFALRYNKTECHWVSCVCTEGATAVWVHGV